MSLFRTTLSGRRPSDMDVEGHLSDPSRKQKYVTFLFDFIAPGYDLFTRTFSFGMDRRWKQTMMSEIRVRSPKPGLVLDLACGTGDLALGEAAQAPGATVVGLDVSQEMLREAVERRGRNGGPAYAAGDILHLALPGECADVVSVGYGFRNTPGFDAGLAEVSRVLKPGGLLVVLDFYKPANRLWRRLYLGYMKVAAGVAGWIWHREPISYAYITPSIEHYVTVEEFSAALPSHGFELQRVYRHLGGGIGIHVATKRSAISRD